MYTECISTSCSDQHYYVYYIITHTTELLLEGHPAYMILVKETESMIMLHCILKIHAASKHMFALVGVLLRNVLQLSFKFFRGNFFGYRV